MAIVIGQIVTETVVAAPTSEASSAPATAAEADLDALVRRATERVLETLRREWDR